LHCDPILRDPALANGVGSSVSLPLTVRGDTIGALNLYSQRAQVTAGEAFAVLREQSQNGNRKLSVLAADIIRSTTGSEPEPPRPFNLRS
jgi:hypothetical protein